jgi:hypothetical protein
MQSIQRILVQIHVAQLVDSVNRHWLRKQFEKEESLLLNIVSLLRVNVNIISLSLILNQEKIIHRVVFLENQLGVPGVLIIVSQILEKLVFL